jgi:hypothetical protein
VDLRRANGKRFALKPTVVTWEEGRQLAWLGHLGIPGVFDGEHHLEVHETEDGKSRFVHWERFSGLLVPLMKRVLAGETRTGFVAMNEALKKRAETRSAQKSDEPDNEEASQ